MDSLTTRNSVKRLLHELKGLQGEEANDFVVYPLEKNIFQWHFTLRGPMDSPYEEGFYHGKLLFPANYPFEPPDIFFLTESGRFQLNMKICISITSYHPENWSPSFTVLIILRALRMYMQSPGHGSVGSLDYPVDTIRQLALESHAFHCTQCGEDVKEHMTRLEKRTHVFDELNGTKRDNDDRLKLPMEHSLPSTSETELHSFTSKNFADVGTHLSENSFESGQMEKRAFQENRYSIALKKLDRCIAYGKLIFLVVTFIRVFIFFLQF
ncbi:Ubiquitin-conjugating enzyme E2 [Perkinsela sp. CCAP 1560/4]|nr:Ubiquitin-conjugating enzyme E2 [Perkinsela sp. CCAP 1560/4]|eukprot:KNH06876.1 Ubiquitin-conjugating enzyme E2 [Perkinsela sp. CCAP 1560/4]